MEAKKAGDSQWEFRPFHRKLAGSPPSVAYCGLKWSWTPRVWDPQASWQNVPVEYSSPSLPTWLAWKDDVLSGTPPPDAESCRITVNAKVHLRCSKSVASTDLSVSCQFILDGQEGHLSHTFHLTIAPVSTIDTSFARSRRSSLAGEPPRRSTSDSAIFQSVQRSVGPCVRTIFTNLYAPARNPVQYLVPPPPNRRTTELYVCFKVLHNA